jgi:methyltransferase-like protein/cyclopropane fatty-acyl-phospholipid synthase-like methyltransferase
MTYDEVQYESYPYSQTQPEQLYTIAKLFDLSAPNFAKARVLELGCASGGNIIPIASRFPKSQCVGVDLSIKQIHAGQAIVDDLALQNIQLIHASITEINEAYGQFDYIICHGIFSWVAQDIRDKIFEICQSRLSPQGIAYISYNTLPGWNMIRSIREMMRFHVQGMSCAQTKASQARALLKFLGEGLANEDSAYAKCLQYEIKLLDLQADSYLLHDHLEEINEPTYFYQFVEQARKFNLNYLADQPLSLMYPGNLPQKFAEEISKITDIVRLNQYMDFVRNQRFRSTLLCHANLEINRQLSPSSITKFYLTYTGKPVQLPQQYTSDEALQFIGPSITLTATHPVAKYAMALLQKNAAKPMAFSELCQQVVTYFAEQYSESQISEYLINQLNLLRLALGGLIHLHSCPGHYTQTVSAYPKGFGLGVRQASEQPWVTNLRHSVIQLTAFEKMLLKCLDGKQSLAQLEAYCLEQVKLKEFKLVDGVQQPIQNTPAQIKTLVAQTLSRFAENALLEA